MSSTQLFVISVYSVTGEDGPFSWVQKHINKITENICIEERETTKGKLRKIETTSGQHYEVDRDK